MEASSGAHRPQGILPLDDPGVVGPWLKVLASRFNKGLRSDLTLDLGHARSSNN